jgi:hypothetical protein
MVSLSLPDLIWPDGSGSFKDDVTAVAFLNPYWRVYAHNIPKLRNKNGVRNAVSRRSKDDIQWAGHAASRHSQPSEGRAVHLHKQSMCTLFGHGENPPTKLLKVFETLKMSNLTFRKICKHKEWDSVTKFFHSCLFTQIRILEVFQVEKTFFFISNDHTLIFEKLQRSNWDCYHNRMVHYQFFSPPSLALRNIWGKS